MLKRVDFYSDVSCIYVFFAVLIRIHRGILRYISKDIQMQIYCKCLICSDVFRS
nr:MAG TPA: hypothetical protein [Caudoviricetes sp.]DAS82096.1 MAG TPA: hypothetical protein [Caudoviricetes sp.]